MELIPLISSLVGAGSALLAPKPPKPPPLPGFDPAQARAPGATVRVGTTEADNTDNASGEYTPFTEKRVTARTIGGLGRGGLGL